MNDGTPSSESLSFVGAPRHRYVKSLSLGLTDAFFSTVRYPWAFLDLVLVFGLFTLGVSLSPYGYWNEGVAFYRVCGGIYAAIFVATTLGLGAYDRANRFDLLTVLRASVVANVIAVVAAPFILYFVYYGVFGRLTLVYGALTSFVGILLFKLLGTWIVRKNPYRFTIIGAAPSMDEVVDVCERKSRAARHYVYTPWQALFAPGEEPTVHKLLVARVGDIVLAKDALANPETVDFVVHCLQAKLRLVDETEFSTQFFERLPIDHISKDWVLRQGLARRQILTLTVKRVLDILLSSIALIVLSPLLLVIALGIRLSSKGPVFFNQRRQGRYSEPFTMFKFRTMSVDVAPESGQAPGGFTQQGDQRVTSFGKLLRPLHLDELPQLLNILRGDMSLVGPRPEALEFAKKMRAKVSVYDLRYLVRPGLTGHAQVNQGYAMDTVDETKRKLAYDLYYLCNHSLWLDLQIILRTVFFLTHRAR